MVFHQVRTSAYVQWKICIHKLHDEDTGVLFYPPTQMHIWTYRDRYHCRDVLTSVCRVLVE